MKKSMVILFLIYLITLGYSQTAIENITFENYPRVDGSISIFPLNKVIACKLLNIEYKWTNRGVITKYDTLMRTRAVRLKSSIPFMNERIQHSPTHEAFTNLIENKTDIIISVHKISEEVKKYADSLEITLIETPIALDALVFWVDEKRGIKSLTTQQIQDVYIGKIDRWETIGGDSAILYPYIHHLYYDYQELMGRIVMKELKKNWDDCIVMLQSNRHENKYAICFSVYNEIMIDNEFPNVQILAINGIEPNSKTITDRTYPYISELYAVIRSDLQENSLAYKLYEWLQGKEGQKTIKECGYIPIKNEFN